MRPIASALSLRQTVQFASAPAFQPLFSTCLPITLFLRLMTLGLTPACSESLPAFYLSLSHDTMRTFTLTDVRCAPWFYAYHSTKQSQTFSRKLVVTVRRRSKFIFLLLLCKYLKYFYVKEPHKVSSDTTLLPLDLCCIKFGKYS